MSFELTIEAEPGRFVSATLGPNHELVIVGRKKGSDLTTTNRTVSRDHAEFRWQDGAVAVRDLDSTAGTFINGKRVQKAVVELGDTVTCGKLEVRVRPVTSEVSESDDDGGGGGTAVLEAYVPMGDLDPSASPAPRGDAPKDDASEPEPAPPEDQIEVQADEEEASSEAADDTPSGGLVFSFVDTDGTTGSFEVVPGGAEIVVGRSKLAHVRVKHKTVSRRHCAIIWRDGKAEVRDLESSAGTYVGGRKITRQVVGPGEKVSAGKLEMTISLAEGASSGSISAHGASAGPRTGPWAIVYADIEGGEHRYTLGSGDEPITIGRGKAATVRIEESTAGREHCEVKYVDGALFVTDLGSRNGTFVNDERTKSQVLAPGDILKCGSFPLTVEGPRHIGAIEDWEENWDDDWTDMDAVSPPIWHLVYSADDGRIEHESLTPSMRILALGSDPDCEICIQNRGIEPDQCEFTWEEGVLVATDLQTDVGTLVRDKRIEERVLKNGDVITAGELRMHVVRGAGRSAPGKGAQRTDEALAWAERFDKRDSSLCLVYCYGDESDPSFSDIGKVELTVWADGEARVEVATTDGRVRGTGRVHEGVTALVFGALKNAGYPTVPASPGADDACPVEISLYQDDYEVTALISHKNMNRMEHYREAIEFLRAIAYELECSAAPV